MTRTQPCDAQKRKGRLAKADQFLTAAEAIQAVIDDVKVDDAYVTLCVHAGIAAADVLCCKALGVHASSENHNDAIGLLARVDKAASNHLRTLLGMKTRSGYSASPVSGTDRPRAERAATALVQAARAA